MITVLRLGHRVARDKRVTTHVALVARAFGADEFILSGERDYAVMQSVEKVARKWGGVFVVRYEKNWKRIIRNFGGKKVHLTMYGMRLGEAIKKIQETPARGDILVIVGAEKVPGEVYRAADFNVSVTNQPHSEVAALAVFLHELLAGSELEKGFCGAEIVVEPSEKGKKVRAAARR